MNNHELNLERRRQRALERLGTNTPRCVVCGFDNPLALELHHIAGRAYDDELVPVCRNCHTARLSDAQSGPLPSARQRKAGRRSRANASAIFFSVSLSCSRQWAKRFRGFRDGALRNRQAAARAMRGATVTDDHLPRSCSVVAGRARWLADCGSRAFAPPPSENGRRHASPGLASAQASPFAPRKTEASRRKRLRLRGKRKTTPRVASAQASPRHRPNGRWFSTPKRPLTRRSACASAHMSSRKGDELDDAGLFYDPAATDCSRVGGAWSSASRATMG